MRYTAHLRTTRRPHVLKRHYLSSAISLLTLSALIGVIALFVNFGHLDSSRLAVGFISSLVRVSVAYSIALVIAVFLAIAITANRTMETVLLPVFDVLQSFPSFALFPVLVSALANAPEVVVISVLVITIVWPILFSIIGGIKNRREDLEEAATIFGAHGWKRFWYLTRPELMPVIVTGSIVGWGEGWEFIIGAELLVQVHNGVGQYLGDLGEHGQNTLLAFGIVVLMLLLFIINRILWLPLLHKSTKYQSET